MGRSKKTSVVELDHKAIEYSENDTVYRVIRLNEKSMNVELCLFEGGVEIGTKTIPFAHLPKKIKQQIRPL